MSAYVAKALLALIALFTNLFFFQRWVTDARSRRPATTSASFVIVVPVDRRADHRPDGALRLGADPRPRHPRSDRGDPDQRQPRRAEGRDAEAALVGDLDRVRRAVRRRGADHHDRRRFGSLIAQFFHLTSAERKTLLVAGAAAGMSATFAAPVAAVLLAVELLLFEWKPRSLDPGGARQRDGGRGAPLHHRPRARCSRSRRIPSSSARQALAGCVVAGLLAGALSALLTLRRLRLRGAFQQLPIHWMWWPAIGGLVIGIGGSSSRRRSASATTRSARCCRATSPAA